MKGKNLFSILAIVLSILASIVNYSYNDQAETSTILEAGNFITSEVAASQALEHETLFGIHTIQEILQQEGVEGLRVYTNSEGQTALTGTDKEGNDMGLIASFGTQNIGIAMLKTSVEPEHGIKNPVAGL